MAGLLLVKDSSLTMEDLYKEKKNKQDPIVASFEREIDFVLNPVLKRNNQLKTYEAHQKL